MDETETSAQAPGGPLLKRQDDALLDPTVSATRAAIPSTSGGCTTCGQVVSEVATGGCASCGQLPAGSRFTAQGQFVYAVGRLAPQFRSLDVEKEFAQVSAGVDSPEVSEHHRLKAVVAQDDNLYLAHHICWVFTTQGIDSFAVVPRDNHDARQLVDAFAPGGDEGVINVVVGRTATRPPAWDWSSTALRLICADQLLSFTLDEFLDALDGTEAGGGAKRSGAKRGEAGADADRRAAMRELFFRLTRRADNQGFTDAHRALNYAALRYPALYFTTLQALDDGKALLGVETRPVPSSDRRLVAVRLTFRDRRTQIVERFSCAIDVTGEFCFLAAPLSPTYD